MQIKTKIVRYHTADSKPVKQEFNGTVIRPPLVFPGAASESASGWNPDTGTERQNKWQKEAQ